MQLCLAIFVEHPINNYVNIMTDNKIRIASMVLACIGLLDSLYLTWVKVSNRLAFCGPLGDCESVNSSQYSEIGGIPIAIFGAGAYVFIILILVLEARSSVWKEYGRYLLLGISLVGTLYSIYLTYLEIAVIHATFKRTSDLEEDWDPEAEEIEEWEGMEIEDDDDLFFEESRR